MAKKKFEMNIGGVVKDMYFSATDVVTPAVTVTATGDVTQALDANKFYVFGEVDSLTLTLNAPTACADGTVPLAMYAGKFTSAASAACTLSLPATVTEGANNPTIEAGKTYEFNIADNVLLMVEV